MPWGFFSSIGKLFKVCTSETNEDIRTSSNIPSTSLLIHNVVIIGSGPAGCTAAIYAGRALLHPIVIAGYNAGGQLMLTSDVENFPGYKKAISGPELMDDLMTQAKLFGAEFRQINCNAINTSSNPFILTLSNKETILARTVIVASGADAIWLKAEDEMIYRGKGVSSCATCDGFLFRNKTVLVIGGGDSAMEEALFLTRFASHVKIIHRRDVFKASKLMYQRARTHPKIEFVTGYQVVKWLGSGDILTGAILESTVDYTRMNVTCEGAFIAIGHKPNSVFLGPENSRDEDGFVKLLENSMTNIPGLFACGDVVDRRYKQAITAAGSGCQAAIDAERWLEHHYPQS